MDMKEEIADTENRVGNVVTTNEQHAKRLAKRSKIELLTEAKRKGIKNRHKLTKEQLVQAIISQL